MSLNRAEQMIFDYLQGQADERQHWQEKVRATGAAADRHTAAARLAPELWRYFEERSAVAEPFRGVARREGVQRTSMKNLAELLLRLWGPPPPARPGRRGESPALRVAGAARRAQRTFSCV